MGMERYRGAPTLLIIAGIGIAILNIGLSLGGFDFLLRACIATQTRLINNTDTWRQWEVIPIPVYLRVRFFNITNPEEMAFGAKPKLKEMGPYVYREQVYKVDITANEENDTVRYRQIRKYYFESELSAGLPTDMITMINIPYVGLAELAHDFTDVDYLLNTLDEMISSKGEKLTRTEMVKDILFDGFNVQPYVDLVKDPLIQSAGEVQLPQRILDGRMGIMEGKNGSDEGWMEVRTGRQASADFGRIVTYQGFSKGTAWKGDPCNMVNGTDGILFQPFLSRDLILQAYVPDLCRSIYFEYTEDTTHDGIPAYRYRQPRRMYQAVSNPDNWCFCPSINDTSKCDIDGLLHVGPCTEGAPLMISQPHFLFVEERILNLVEGLNPDPEIHWGYMDLHPVIGLALEAKHRLQFNMKISQWESMPTFANVTPHILPILWVEEGATLVGKNKTLLKLLSVSLFIWGFGKYFLIFFGAVIMPALALSIVYLRRKSDEVKLVLKSAQTSAGSLHQ